jgi:AcrR family transcriptional regulator
MRHDTSVLAIDREQIGRNIRDASIRRRILVVAKHRFARFGFEETSLDDIARSSDISETELRVHFDNKRSILAASLNEGWEPLNQRLADIVRNSIRARDAMLSMLAFTANLLEQDEDFVRLFLFEGRRPDAESSEISLSYGYRRFMQTCAEIVIRGQKDGSFRPGLHPQVIASMLIGAIEGMVRDRLVAEQTNSITPYNGTYLMSAFDALVSSLKA